MNTISKILANVEAEAGSGKIFLEAEAFKKMSCKRKRTRKQLIFSEPEVQAKKFMSEEAKANSEA